MEDGHSDVSKPPVPPACVPGAESDKTIHVSSRAEDVAAGHSSAGAGTGVNDSTHSSHGQFECNVCFEDATDPVITRCGHLFWYVPLLRSLPMACLSQKLCGCVMCGFGPIGSRPFVVASVTSPPAGLACSA